MSNLPPDLQEKILNAQTLNGVLPSEPLVLYKNIGELLEHQAGKYEQKPFLIYYGNEEGRREYSYTAFHEAVQRTANLMQGLGISRSDRVATVSFNHADVVIQYFAALVLGAVIVPINVGEEDERVGYILRNSHTKLAFVREPFLDRIIKMRSILPDLKTVVQVGRKARPDLPHFQTELVKQSARFSPRTPPGLQDEALIVYTSGTTGLPKGVVLVQYNLLVDAMAIADWHRLSEDQRMMCVLPIHHVNGTVVTLITPLYFGGGVVLNQKFHSDNFFERISIEKVHVVSVVPTLLQFLLSAKLTMSAYKLAHFRHIICGAGPLTIELARKFEQEFNIPIIHGYGLSETTCYSCFLPLDLNAREHTEWISKYGYPSIGVPLPANEMAIHDEHGNELDEEQKGEIVIRGHNVMKYYFENVEANEKAFTHSWFRSGDEGFFKYDAQGRKFFFITGRIKELIIRGGVNISPLEIDEVLMKMPGVEAAIAIGFDNDWYGEEVGAYVKVRPGVEMTDSDVLNYCRKTLPFSKSPKVVVFGDSVPVTSTGKYQRNKCKDLFAQWKTTQFTDRK